MNGGLHTAHSIRSMRQNETRSRLEPKEPRTIAKLTPSLIGPADLQSCHTSTKVLKEIRVRRSANRCSGSLPAYRTPISAIQLAEQAGRLQVGHPKQYQDSNYWSSLSGIIKTHTSFRSSVPGARTTVSTRPQGLTCRRAAPHPKLNQGSRYPKLSCARFPVLYNMPLDRSS